MLATGGSDKYIRLWEIPTNGHAYPNGVLQGSPGAINALDFDNEGVRKHIRIRVEHRLIIVHRHSIGAIDCWLFG